ncbi:hypothetical protein SPKIRA_37570 (plasmid) [Sphingomonas paucimobilis]|uniref:hypothetical protein n=1 Tax=Sphingomonas paucimobilis TaxID=13689 RepID=UPI0015DD164A|nr:hypothetical protein [Sphingomonas paucimobilis]BCI72927.1 hypothetical protein SPKIRA_37570 [Sphingomonas paucimobilis]
MAAIGIALQIKYSVLPEGVAFGCILLWHGWRTRVPMARLAGMALGWIALALLPTLVAYGVYATMGHGPALAVRQFPVRRRTGGAAAGR